MAVYILPDSGQSLIVTFDLVVSEGHESTSEVTEHPVERGSNIADHVRQNPQGLTLELYVTNTPIEDLGRGAISILQIDVPTYTPPLAPTPGALFSAAENGINQAIRGNPGPVKAQVLGFPSPFDRVKEVHDALLDLWKNGITSSVVTSVMTYDTMVLTRINMPRTEPGGATFNLDLKQIRTVTTASVAAPKPAEKRGAPSQSKGSQSTRPVGSQDAAKASSLATKALEALGQLLP
jgi:hypothetical protein